MASKVSLPDLYGMHVTTSHAEKIFLDKSEKSGSGDQTSKGAPQILSHRNFPSTQMSSLQMWALLVTIPHLRP